MKIRVSTLVQYFLIYIMLIMSYSSMAEFVLNKTVLYVFLLAFFAFLLLVRTKYRNPYALIGVGILAMGMVFQRLISGGVGIGGFLQLAMPVLCTHMAISSNKDEFLNRFLKVVCFFAVISNIFWALFLVFPELVEFWPAEQYFTQTIGTQNYATDWHGKGFLLYSYLEIHPTRNCGIYTEPGVHQIVLNSALFILLFWRDKLSFKSQKAYNRALFLIFFTIITCQSTTGYLAMLIIVMAYMLFNRSEGKSKTKRRIALLGILAVLLLILEYSLNGTDSILHQQIIEKLFGDSKSLTLDLSQGSGQYRIGTILYCLAMIAEHPLGVGYDVFTAGKGEGMVAAALLSFACVYGVITWAAVLIWLLTPVVKKEKPVIAITFILMFVNTTLAQTLLLYPAQLLFPIYLAIAGVQRGKTSDQELRGRSL